MTALQFGLELEMLICPRDVPRLTAVLEDLRWDPSLNSSDHEKDKNRKILRKAVVIALTEAGVKATADEKKDYTMWGVVDETSLVEHGKFCKHYIALLK
jgi:hypothetical protein